MPSPNPRIQVCATPDLYARVKTMAKGRGITLSNMAQELCEIALATAEVRAEYEHHCKESGEVPVKEDQRKRPQARPWSVDYSEEKHGISHRDMDALVQAKRQGRMTKEQEEKAAEGARDKKKELLVSVLKELLED